MKKYISTIIALSLVFSLGCKKKEEKKEEGPIAKKYAKYKVAVRKDKDLKNWLATLEKAEEVDLLSEEEVIVMKKGKKVILKIAKVNLADGSTGYVESRHLADKSIVFMEDTKALIRPTSGSKVHATIPKDTIGFIVGEKGNWVQVYVGKIDGKWVTKQWVNSGYSTDESLIADAKENAKKKALDVDHHVIGTSSEDEPWLNLREGKTTKSPVIAQLPDGTSLKVLNSEGNFWEVEVLDGDFKGKRGFAYRTYIKPKEK